VPNSFSNGGNFIWTYSNGTVVVSGGPSFSVAAGGRLLIFAVSDNRNANGDSELMILTRLQ